MTEHSSYETNKLYPNLLDNHQFRLNKINEIRDYFVAEIKERESMSKRISKYIAFFNIAFFNYFVCNNW